MGICNCAHAGATDRAIARNVAIDLFISIPFSLNLPKEPATLVFRVTPLQALDIIPTGVMIHEQLDIVKGYQSPPTTCEPLRQAFPPGCLRGRDGLWRYFFGATVNGRLRPILLSSPTAIMLTSKLDPP